MPLAVFISYLNKLTYLIQMTDVLLIDFQPCCLFPKKIQISSIFLPLRGLFRTPCKYLTFKLENQFIFRLVVLLLKHFLKLEAPNLHGKVNDPCNIFGHLRVGSSCSRIMYFQTLGHSFQQTRKEEINCEGKSENTHCIFVRVRKHEGNFYVSILA